MEFSPLTKTQARILTFLGRYFLKNGQCPSAVEIASYMQFKSKNAAEYQLQCLERKGYVMKFPGTTRVTFTSNYEDVLITKKSGDSILPKTVVASTPKTVAVSKPKREVEMIELPQPDNCCCCESERPSLWKRFLNVLFGYKL